VLGLLGALTACAALDADRPRPSDHADRLAEHVALMSQQYTQAQHLSAEQVARELSRAQASFALVPSLAHWRRLMFLVLLPQAPGADREAALELLQTHHRPVASPSEHGLYLVSEEVLADYLQLLQEARETHAARVQIIDELEQQLELLTAARDRLAQDKRSLKEQLHTEQVRIRTLQRQLDEIRKIEQTLEDRNRTAPARLPEDDDPSQR
jgi:hypothetical protein